MLCFKEKKQFEKIINNRHNEISGNDLLIFFPKKVKFSVMHFTCGSQIQQHFE